MFFENEGIDTYGEAALHKLSDKDREYVQEFFFPGESVIIFSKAVPVEAYSLSAREQTDIMLGIAQNLNETAIRLEGLLAAEGIPARHVPLYLPVRITDGQVRGVVRLKQVAAAAGLGTTGKSTLLLNREHGPRLILSGVVTGESSLIKSGDMQEEIDTDSTPGQTPDICIECGKCIKACPSGAIRQDGVETFRCRTISPWVPEPVVPIAKWLIGRQLLLRFIAPIAPWIAKAATIRCSRCVTECPVFDRGD
ncbi:MULTISPECIES: 4Fe-4S binding protein [Methanocalculus]|uniref:4Fe-4S binding protein n=1 Tax=Methanocalculus TaxID=71151 RepID=UPI00209EDF66|nr:MULTISPECIES: 4Fe-4S binding protein [unclassified Methanocalculus]MCP1662561.1 epoxyqueuosine reductase QueG [Methanocalculus sp. AMF5]